jgi:hypothetical protein
MGYKDRKVTIDIWQDFLSHCKLSVCQFPASIGQLTVPNLIYLALENVGEEQESTVQSILDMLHGCPLLETVLIIHAHTTPQETTLDHSPVPFQTSAA